MRWLAMAPWNHGGRRYREASARLLVGGTGKRRLPEPFEVVPTRRGHETSQGVEGEEREEGLDGRHVEADHVPRDQPGEAVAVPAGVARVVGADLRLAGCPMHRAPAGGLVEVPA